MTFDKILAQVQELLQGEGRVSYRALKIRFNLDDEYLEMGGVLRFLRHRDGTERRAAD